MREDTLVSFDGLMSSLKGGITTEEGALLRRLASEVSEGCIVEVGSFRGKSAVALAAGVRERQADQRLPIYCVEPHRPFTGFYGGKFGPQDRGAFYDVMCQTGAFNEVALLNLSSEEVAPAWKEPVGLVFIDGDHHYDAVKRDFECWDPHVIPGGLVAFDDANDPACGPHRLIGEILDTGRYRQVAALGKIVVLSKTHDAANAPKQMPMCRQRLLVACHDIVLSGGLLRFDRVGMVLRDWGHEVAFVVLADSPAPERRSALPVLSLDQALARQWDAVMVPGAGFPDETIEKFALFREKNFGVRVQHVLNDQSRRPHFKKVNHFFAPHVIIFNNLHWPAGSFTEFAADRFHVLPGAVDLRTFRPSAYRSHPLTLGKWIVGGLANKNPQPLVEALADLPPEVVLRLFGPDHFGLANTHVKMIDAGRLEFTGPLHGQDLCRFYRDVDCVAMTETVAGWSNLVAEAMASGVPVVCTPHGTAAFAHHEETALVIDTPTPAMIAAGLRRLIGDPALCRHLTELARETIAAYSWDSYARQMLPLLRRDDHRHYIHAPEFGLHGKWPLDERLNGLEPLLDRSHGLSVVDFGAAEGLVARELLKHGATRVHGFELDQRRVNVANDLCAPWRDSRFRLADLSDWDAFQHSHADLLEDAYDIVLYLGIQHHLPVGHRLRMLKRAVGLARRYFAIRTTDAVYETDGIEGLLRAEGFHRLASITQEVQSDHLGVAKIYERRGLEGEPSQ